MALFYANSTTLGWEGSVAGITFKQQGRFEHSGQPQFRMIARADQPENSYLLTVESNWDGSNTYISVERGEDFPAVISRFHQFDFHEDMSDGKQHSFDLENSSAKVSGLLQLKIIR